MQNNISDEINLLKLLCISRVIHVILAYVRVQDRLPDDGDCNDNGMVTMAVMVMTRRYP
jgi:hypothetical protein